MDKPEICSACGHIISDEIIVLSPAYIWDCPNCGRENFQRSITTLMTEEDHIKMGLDMDEGGYWTTNPSSVVCRWCNKNYKTRHVVEDTDD